MRIKTVAELEQFRSLINDETEFSRISKAIQDDQDVRVYTSRSEIDADTLLSKTQLDAALIQFAMLGYKFAFLIIRPYSGYGQSYGGCGGGAH